MTSKGSPALRWGFAALVVAAVAALAWGAFGGRPSPDQAAPQTATTEQDEIAAVLKSLQRRQPDDPFALGRTDAPVVMIMYEDYRCPFCSKFTADIKPQLIERYVDTGVLRLEWRDFPIFGEESLEIAKAARAAAHQGRFWEFHNAAYARGNGGEKPSFPEETIQEVAREAGVPDLAKFNADRNDPAIMQAIQTDATEGQALGVSSTPSFIVNSQPVLGAQPLDQFVAVIEAERAKV
ncbi:Protein-disulfide isomerase [Saccharopolyspora antimicrobica]|uniref:Protein-disulfide isomerase n=1 Tax=Saccharopolyspora antimicrobica TaxID=455193 RepID=A0A1I5LXU2_9PSEU|nr:thioredoxin domain-containing protein [Saccharopolyspora antimicrobica]RKT89053.1 protein-disulfide isomerase [Saccharopolyspora antimicrobica]SFP01987.1 Protein-disulfide isomerase [Saccharopolyspora antimicrobica]